jgi:tetratricopeptide (TPR) repeat protein
LTTGARDLPERQQTLRATVDWSHSLLNDDEKLLFRRMSVFSGGCTLEVLESVGGNAGSSLDLLESLVDNELVQISATGRCSMLQTVAEYAAERLAESGEADEVAARHAAAFVAVARDIRHGMERDHQIASVQLGIAEEQNLSLALDTLLAASRAGDSTAAETGLRACGDLNLYWHVRGKNLTAREISNAFLDSVKSGNVSRSATAAAMRTAGLGAWALGDIELANQEWAAATELARAAGDPVELCFCTLFAVFGLIGVDGELGRRCAAEALELARRLDYPWAVGLALVGSGFLRHVDGDLEDARSCLSEALAVCESIGDCEGMGLSLSGLAALVSDADPSHALDLYERSLNSFEAIGDRAEEARVLSEMAPVHLRIGAVADARHRLHGAVRAYLDIGSVRGVGLAILGLAAVAAHEGLDETAATIAAAGERYTREQGIVNVYTEEAPGLDLVERSRAALDAVALERASSRGAALSVDEALALSDAQ